MTQSDIEADVLVIGCGPSGLLATLSLASAGNTVLAVTKHPQLAPTPRAHLTNQRSFEIFRDFGLEDQARALAIPYREMPDAIFWESLVGEEYGRMRGLGADAEGLANGLWASPCEVADLPQHLLEPMLFEAGVKAGADVRFGTEFLSLDQDDQGVTARLLDRRSGDTVRVRAQYLIGADGGRSVVAKAIDLPMEGAHEIGESLNILFDCDLSAYVAHRPALLYFMVRSAGQDGGPGLGILRCIKPWSSWMLIRGYAPGQKVPIPSDEEAVAVVRDYLGVAHLTVRITGVDPWTMNASHAATYQRDRVFCVGDAVHRHVPSNGLGSNTGMQDAYNLGWKLDLVLKGKAGSGLLDTYSSERVPVGRQIVERATASMVTYGPILEAVGALDDVAQTSGGGAAALKDSGAAGVARRRQLRNAIDEKKYEFRTRGVELNQFYRSDAIVDEGQEPAETGADLQLFYRPTSSPGARVPHAWVQRHGRSVSILDLVGKGRFVLLTGIAGGVWREVTASVCQRLGTDITIVTIGPGGDYEDLYFEWADLRETAEDGCLLVRPDGHIAWRCMVSGNSTDAEAELAAAMSRILAKE